MLHASEKSAVIFGRIILLIIFYLTYGLGLTNLRANPSGEAVMNGEASFVRDGSTLSVTNTDGTIINWQDFSIQNGELTKFIQPDSMSSVLNRVVGSNLSAIYGTLQSNGQVILINPNGIVIGAGGIVDTAGFVASTLDLSNSDFLSGGQLKFVGESMNKVENFGKIDAGGGDVFLISRHVVNAGTIKAPNGTVGLYASDEVYLTEGGANAGRGFVRIDAPKILQGTGLENSGTIDAARAELKATGNLYALAINNTGTVRATGTETINGVIHFSGKGGTVVIAGQSLLRASTILKEGLGSPSPTNGASPATPLLGHDGGRILVEGDQIALLDEATVDASGSRHGGEILIGGDYQGKNAEIYNAQKVYVASGVNILADGGSELSTLNAPRSTASGHGGKIILWSDNWNKFYGSISARGGDLGGDGGFVEVSGKQNLAFAGIVDVGAVVGYSGTILLDPRDIIIVAGAASSQGGDTYLGDSQFLFAEPDTVTDFNISTGTLQALTGNILLEASRDISFSAALNLNLLTSGETLTARAKENIFIQQGLTTNGGSVILQADSDNAGNPGRVFLNNNITTNGGDITVFGNGSASNNNGINFSSTFTLSSSGGTISLTGRGQNGGGADSNGINIQGTINAGSGNINLTGTGGSSAGAASSGVNVTASGNIITTGTITINGTGGNGSAVSNNHGVRIEGLVSSGTGNISIQGTAGNLSDNAYGIYVISSSGNVTSTTGNINLVGNASSSTADANIGIGMASNAAVRSTDGNISMTGTGGSGGQDNHGIYMDSTSQVSTNGTGNINMVGQGGTAATGVNNVGIRMSGTTTYIFTTSSGNITLQGSGGGSGAGSNSNHGMFLTNDSNIGAQGSGNLTITATGGTGTGGSNYGFVAVGGSADTFTNTGTLSLTAASGVASSVGLELQTAADIFSYGNGTISIKADKIGALSANVIYSGAGGKVIVDSISAAAAIGLGTGAVTTGLYFTSAQMTAFSPSTGHLIFGSTGRTGVIEVANQTFAQDVSLLAGTGTVQFVGAGAVTFNNDLLIASNNTGTGVTQGGSVALVAGGLVLQGSANVTLLDNLNSIGNVAGSLTGTGTVNLITNSSLTLGSVTVGTATSTGLQLVSNNVTLQTVGTTNDLTLNEAITKTSGTDVTVNLRSNRSILATQINSDITSTSGKIDLTLNADRNADNDGRVQLGTGTANQVQILTNGGNFTVHGSTTTASAVVSNTAGIGGFYTNGANVTTAGGNVFVRAQAVATGNNNRGIYGSSTFTLNAGGGNITLIGTGGGSGAGTDNIGIRLDNGNISTSGAGQISLTGTGGTFGDTNDGIVLNVAHLTAATGNITLLGTGRGTGTGSDGVEIGSSNITTTSGLITITGNTIASGASNNRGVNITGASGTISSTSGALAITGNSSNVTTGVGVLTVGLSAKLGSASHTGTITITSNNDIQLDGGIQTSGAGGDITLQADRHIFLNNANSDITATGGDLILNSNRDATGGGSVVIGNGVGGATVLNTAGGNITIGGGATPLTVAAEGDAAATKEGVNINGAFLDSAAGNISILGTGGTNVSGSNFGVQLTAGGRIAATTGTIQIRGTGGTSSGTNHGVVLSSSNMTVSNGLIDVRGTGGTGTSSAGLATAGGMLIGATGTGAIDLRGTGTAAISANYGVVVSSGTVRTVSGNIAIQGTSAHTASSAVFVASSATIGNNTQTGAINLYANTYDLDLGGAVITGGGNVDLRSDRHINLTNGNSDITTNGGNLIINSDRDGVGGGRVLIGDGTAGNVVLSLGAGNLTIGGGATPLTGAATGDAVALEGVKIDGAYLNVTTGNISIRGSGGSNAGGGNAGIKIENNSNLTASGAGSIQILGTSGSVGNASRGVEITTGSTITHSGTGNLIITGISAATTSTNNHGVLMGGDSVITSTSSANIFVTGTGGEANGGTSTGILISGGANLTTTGAGNLTIIGSSNATTGAGQGVTIDDSNGGTTSTVVTVNTGTLTITGTGGNTTANNNHGIIVDSSNTAQNVLVGATGVGGSLTGTGTSGTGTGDLSLGIYLRGSGAAGGLVVSTTTGNLTLLGTSFGTGTQNHGIMLNNGARASSTTGAIDLRGTAGNGTFDNVGLVIADAFTRVDSTSGNITLIGITNSTTGISNRGLFLAFMGTAVGNGIETGGTISIVGTGGLGGDNNDGIYINGSRIDATGAMNMTGRGRGTGVNSVGIEVTGSALVRSGGDMVLAGNSQASGNQGAGFYQDSGSVSTTGAGNILISGTGNGAGTNSDGITLDSTANVTSSGTGTITINGTAGNASSAGFRMASASTALLQGGANNITINTDSINLAAGTITSTGIITLAPLTASSTIGLGAGTGTFQLTDAELDIVQNSTTNLVIGHASGTGAVDVNGVDLSSLTSGNVTIRNPGVGSGNIVFNGAMNVGTNELFLDTAGDLTQIASGIITAQGNDSNGGLNVIMRTANATISLGLATNDLGESINYVGNATQNGNVRDVTIRNTSATAAWVTTNYGNVTNIRDATFIFPNATNYAIGANLASGNVSLTTGGNITQTGNQLIGGTTVITTTGNITLNDPTNNFTGAVTLVTSGASNVSLRDTNALVLGNITVGTGTIGIISGGDLTQTGNITQAAGAGNVSFTGNGNITLNSVGNDFVGSVFLNQSGAGVVNLRDVNALILNTFNVNGSAVLTAGGNLSQQAGSAVSITGTTSITTPGSITLANTSNSFGGTVTLTAGSATNLSLYSTGGLTVSTSTDTTITSLGSNGGNITLTNSGTGNVTVAGGVGSNGGNITLQSTNALTVNALIDSSPGSSGSLSVSGATVNVAPVAGTGTTITLIGGGLDLIISVDQISATTINLSAVRDIIVQALLQTTSATADINLNADSNNDGDGGLWLQAAGSLISAGNAQLSGSNLNAVAGADSVRIEADGTNTQIQSAGTLTLTTKAAGAASSIYLGGKMVATGAFAAQDDVVLTAATTVQAASLNFAQTVTGSQALTLSSTAAITQNGAWDVSKLSATSSGNIVLTNSANKIPQLDQINSSGGRVEVRTVGTDLTIVGGGVVQASNDLTLATNQKFINQSSSTALSNTGGGRWVVYSNSSADDTRGGLSGSEDYSKDYPTLPSFSGNGFVQKAAAPVVLTVDKVLPDPIITPTGPPIFPPPNDNGGGGGGGPGPGPVIGGGQPTLDFGGGVVPPPIAKELEVVTDSKVQGDLENAMNGTTEKTAVAGDESGMNGGKASPEASEKMAEATDEKAEGDLAMLLGEGTKFEGIVIEPDGLTQINALVGVIPISLNFAPPQILESLDTTVEQRLRIMIQADFEVNRLPVRAAN